MYLLSTETLETKQIPNSPNCLGEGLPAFSHSGEYLAYWCFRTACDAGLYSLPLPDGKPKMIASFRAFPNGLTWSADDEKLIYSLNSLGVSSPMNSAKLLLRMGRRLPPDGNVCCSTVGNCTDLGSGRCSIC